MFFTDTKRGAVLQLQGASANSDQLQVISEYGMRSWFRDQFLDQLETQKLGGFDPYMNEYVLCTNNRENISISLIYECGTTIEQAETDISFSYEINFGNAIGDIVLDYTVTTGTADIDFTWNGNTESETTTLGTNAGSLTLNKNLPAPTTATVTVTPTGTDPISFEIVGQCAEVVEIEVIKIVINGSDTFGQFTTFGYNWTNGTYNSPIFTEQTQLQFNNPSAYSSATGASGFGLFPSDGVSLTMSISKTNTDDFVFNPLTNRFAYHVSDILYTGAPGDLATLLGLSTTVALPYNNPSGDNYNVTIDPFNIPAGDDKIYLIYDLRNVTSNTMCYSNVSIEDACCGCPTTCSTAFFGPQSSNILDVCNSDTNSTGSAQNSFYGVGNIPVIGEPCFLGTNCDVSDPLPEGYYIVDQASPSVTVPKNWIQVDINGIVINSGTC